MADTTCSVSQKICRSRVSSVLNKDTKQFGKNNLFDNSEETCWNSDQGSPQWILLEFSEEVFVKEIHIQFHGGFVGKNCWLESSRAGSKDLTKFHSFYPQDINQIQVFSLPEMVPLSSLKIVFDDSTDFFGRITIYKLDILGKSDMPDLAQLTKMALNMQQQITVAAWAIAYKNDREAVRLAKRDFNITLLPSTVGKWRQRLLTTGSILKGKPPGRPRKSTDAATTEKILEAFSNDPQKSTRQRAQELGISQSSVSRALRREKCRTLRPIRIHKLKEDNPASSSSSIFLSENVTSGGQ